MTPALADTSNGIETRVLDLHKKFLETGKPHPNLLPFNESSINRFETLGFPHSKHEMYTFVNTKKLAATGFSLQREGQIEKEFIQRHIYPGCESSYLVLVDGVFRPELSNPIALGTGLKISSLADAVSDPSIKKYLSESIDKENDAFAAINGAFLKHGVFLEVPPKKHLECSLQILHVSTGSDSEPVTTHPRLFVKLGKLSELRMIIKFAGKRGNYFVNCVQDFLVGEGGGITYAQVQSDPSNSWNFCKSRFHLDRNSWTIADNACHGARLVRNHFEVHLKDVNAELRLNGVSVLKNEEQVHNFVRVHHESPHCTSNQKFKNVINDKGRASFDGTVIVNPGAQLTYSDQLINNLMLSDEARADNKPTLMIFADDVKCTHGATVGQIDETQLFYLTTRGLSQDRARELLTKSFAESIIQEMKFPMVVEDLNNTLLKKLEQGHG